MLEEEYDKDHWTRYIEDGPVTTIVIFLYINIGYWSVEAQQTFLYVLVGSFDP
jgi:hypothetical protein